jgi:PleD family two-component response regulator
MIANHDGLRQTSEQIVSVAVWHRQRRETVMPSAAKRPILVVEDEVLVSMVVEELVAEAGFDPVVAHDADAAIALLAAEVEGFSAVLTDIRTPGKTTGWRESASLSCPLST